MMTEIIHGKIKEGYCYDFQCWILDFKVQPCGHPENMKPDCCFAGKNAGRDIRDIYAESDPEAGILEINAIRSQLPELKKMGIAEQFRG